MAAAPFTNPTYADVRRWFDANRGRSRSRKITEQERETRAYWRLPYTAGKITGSPIDSPGHYVWEGADGALVWHMHNTDIVVWYPDGLRSVWHGGFLGSPTTRDMLSTLTNCRVRQMGEQAWSDRIETRDRIMVRQSTMYSHGVPFDRERLIDRDGAPLDAARDTDSVRVTNPERRAEAMAFRRRVVRLAKAAAALLPNYTGSAAVYTPSTNWCASTVYALRNCPNDEELTRRLCEVFSVANPNVRQDQQVPCNPVSAMTLLSTVFERGLYDEFDVYEWSTVPSCDLHKYLPSWR